MKILLTILALLNGGYMLIDGLYVMLKGKYIGPEKPGPWASLFEKLGVNVYKLGPLFILFGVLWLSWLLGFWTKQNWVYSTGILLCILTLWYLPVVTVFSLVILTLLISYRAKWGF